MFTRRSAPDRGVREKGQAQWPSLQAARVVVLSLSIPAAIPTIQGGKGGMRSCLAVMPGVGMLPPSTEILTL